MNTSTEDLKSLMNESWFKNDAKNIKQIAKIFKSKN